MKNSGVKKAIKAAGGCTELGKAIGLTKQAVNKWDRVPSDHVLAVEQFTGIPREDLRPDLYPKQRRR